MKYLMKNLAVLSAFAPFGAAVAANISVDGVISAGDQFRLTSSSASLQFDASLLGALDYAGVTFGAVGPATYNASTANVSTSVSSFAYESSNKAMTSLSTVGGGAFNMATSKSILGIPVGGPGNISFTNLTINAANKVVSASVSGANGVQAGIYDIFTFGNLSGNTTFNGAGTYSLSATQLALTNVGVSLVSQGLKLGSIGTSVLSSVKDLGVMSGKFTVAAVTPAVPEPSTYALMGLGFAGLLLASRRRSAA